VGSSRRSGRNGTRWLGWMISAMSGTLRTVARAQSRLVRALAPRRIPEGLYERLNPTMLAARLIGGIAALGVAWLLPGLDSAGRARLTALILLAYMPYVAVLYVVIPRIPQLGLRVVANGLGDLFVLMLFYVEVPSIRTVVLFGSMVYLAFHAIVAGLLAGFPFAAALGAAVVGVELWGPNRTLDGFELFMFVVIALLFALILDALTREWRTGAKHLELLERALTTTSTAADLETTLQSFVASVADAIGAPLVAIVLKTDDRLEVAATHGAGSLAHSFRRAIADRGREVLSSPTSGPLAMAMASGEPVVVQEIRSDPRYERFRDEVIGMGLLSSVIVPLRRETRSIGALTVYFDRRGAVDLDDVALLASYADQIALSILRALAHEQEREVAARLRETDDLKTEFVATLSHELRTPLTATKGMLDLLNSKWDRFDDRQRQDLISDAATNAERLARLVDQVFDFTRLERATIELATETRNLESEISRLVKRLRPLLTRHKVEIQIPAAMRATFDPSALEHVVSNLLTNAVKFSPPGSQITITAKADGTEVIVSVRDEGVGIPLTEHEQIFDYLFQGGRRQAAGSEGAGIGLSLVRSYVQLLGGRVWVDSKPDAGSTFHFTLPNREAGYATPSSSLTS
jgi:signal transduction histidine kinase